MDYPKLFVQLPKQPIKWTISDTELWLKFIGLNSLADKFRSFFKYVVGELSIDGSCLPSLTEQDLRDEINIKSGITIKKIMSWITKGLQQYEEYVKSPIAGASEIPYSDIKEVTQKSKMNKLPSLIEDQKQMKQFYKQSSYKNISGESSFKPELLMQKSVSGGDIFQVREPEAMEEEEEDQEKRKQYELIIQNCDGPQTSFYSVKEEGAKIGRHSSNQILILDEGTSRFHAEIKFKDGDFLLRDTGSTTGTFIKITQKIHILPEMIIEMGSNQFQAHFIDNVLTLQIIEGPGHGTMIEIPRNTKITIGRKQTNHINFPDDQHLSNIHSTIYSIQNKYFLEDMGTTNGSWHRLSLEGEASPFYELSDKLIFKIGSNQTYSCKIKMAYVSEKTNPNACIICYENDKDCVYMPCKHNTACIKCSKTLRQCPICRLKIEDFVRIYKS